MLSVQLKEFAFSKFKVREPYYETILEELEKGFADCSAEEEILMRFFYGTMPIRDAGEYRFELFLSYVRHALWLREHVKWCRDLQEDLFVHHVLYYRINSEDISDCRAFFCEQLKERIEGLSLKEAILEINYWCAEHVVYESTDNRTASPMTLFQCGKGRCGEESTFAVTAFRSVGIPARQVYTPRWAHCDDNHAWVEVYLEGSWYFLGACEPEAVLNKGWFSGPASRAILIHSRTFSDYQNDSCEECLGSEGLLVYYNQTERYARTAVQTVTVYDREQRAVPYAQVALEILNMAEYFPAAVMTADSKGQVRVTTGLGEVRIRACKDGSFGEQTAAFWKSNEVSVTLQYGCAAKEGWVLDQWQHYELMAPPEVVLNSEMETDAQKEENERRTKEAGRLREERLNGFYRRELSEQYPEEESLFRTAGNNSMELYTFLTRDENPNRRRLLHSLSVKDAKDAKADILETHLDCEQGDWPDEIFVPYLLCPRVDTEELKPYRQFIRAYFGEEQKDSFRKRPEAILDFINQQIRDAKEVDYETISATPAGCLKLGYGNQKARNILFAAICRSLMIPARLNPATQEPEYYRDGAFRSPKAVKRMEQEAELLLRVEEEEVWNYFQTWSIGMFREGKFESLDFEGIKFEDRMLNLKLRPGVYRLITTKRRPDGGQSVSERCFLLAQGEKKEIEMNLKETNLDELLVSKKLDEILLTSEEGENIRLSELVTKKPVVAAFLGVGAEPTEHVLNELLECRKRRNDIASSLLLILKSKEDLANETLSKVLKQIPDLPIYFAPKGSSEKAARRMEIDPDKLPVLVVVKEGLYGIYACSGYNVGSVELTLTIAER